MFVIHFTAPEGLAPPTLLLQNSTTVQVSWTPPETPNGIITHYELVISNDRDTPLTLDLGLSTSTIVSDLQPFTEYTVYLFVYNSVGSTNATASIITGETGEGIYIYVQMVLELVVFF